MILADHLGPVTGAGLEAGAERVAGALARALRDAGGGPVAVLCGSHRGLAGALLAAGPLCADLRLVNPALGRMGVRRALAGAPVVLHDPDTAGLVRGAAGPAETAAVSMDVLAAFGLDGAAPLGRLRRAPRPRRAGRIELLTSGTTGAPATTTRGGLAPAQAPTVLSLLAALGLRRGEPALLAPPLTHGHGLSLLVAAFLTGAPAVLAHGRTPAETLGLIEEHDARVLLAVPAQLSRLLTAVEAAEGPDPRPRRVVTGSAPLDPALAVAVRRRWGEVLVDYFGTSETGTATIARPADLREAPGTVGRPATGMRVLVLDDDGRELPAGAVGRVAVASPWRAAGASGGAVPTGDLGRLDATGRLFLHGRADDLVVTGGHNVSLAPVRQWFAGRPEIAAVTVRAVPDPVLGKAVEAEIKETPDRTADLAVLARQARRDLGPAAPRTLRRVRALGDTP